MTIGIDIRCLMSPVKTGVGEYTRELLTALFAIDRENQYILFYNSATDVSAYLPKWEYPNVQYVGTKWPNKMLNVLMVVLGIPQIENMIKRKLESGIWNMKPNSKFQIPNFSLDYFFCPNPNFFALSLNTRLILTIHDLSFELLADCYTWKRRLWHWIVNPRKLCKRAHLVLVPSENTKRDVVSLYHVPESKVKVVKPGLASLFVKNYESGIMNYGTVNERYNLPKQYMLFVGTIEPRKNIDGLLDAYELYCQKQVAPLPLVIAGPYGWKSKHVMRRLKTVPGVQYIGYVAEEDKPALYRGASLFLYPSLYEGFGFPVLEAFAAGVPVITSDRSSLPEVGGSAAYLVNPLNAAEIAAAIDHVLWENEEDRNHRREAGFQQVGYYSWASAADQFCRLLLLL